MPLRVDYEQQRLHLIRKHGVDLGDGSRCLDRKDLDALMGGDDVRSGTFIWREKCRRKVKAIVLVLARSFHLLIA